MRFLSAQYKYRQLLGSQQIRSSGSLRRGALDSQVSRRLQLLSPGFKSDILRGNFPTRTVGHLPHQRMFTRFFIACLCILSYQRRNCKKKLLKNSYNFYEISKSFLLYFHKLQNGGQRRRFAFLRAFGRYWCSFPEKRHILCKPRRSRGKEQAGLYSAPPRFISFQFCNYSHKYCLQELSHRYCPP